MSHASATVAGWTNHGDDRFTRGRWAIQRDSHHEEDFGIVERWFLFEAGEGVGEFGTLQDAKRAAETFERANGGAR